MTFYFNELSIISRVIAIIIIWQLIKPLPIYITKHEIIQKAFNHIVKT